jgi:hypothetical protein
LLAVGTKPRMFSSVVPTLLPEVTLEVGQSIFRRSEMIGTGAAMGSEVDCDMSGHRDLLE